MICTECGETIKVIDLHLNHLGRNASRIIQMYIQSSPTMPTRANIQRLANGIIFHQEYHAERCLEPPQESTPKPD